MATRSIIAIQTNNNIKATYCHWDGHLDNVGKIIQENYQDENKVNQLIDLGFISSLRSEIGEKHPFDTPYDQNLTHEELDLKREEHDALYGHMTTFYKRDRGEDDASSFSYDSQEQLLNDKSYDSEFIYLLADSEWQVASQDTNWAFKSLTSQLEENNISFTQLQLPQLQPTSTTIHLGKIDATGNGIKDNAVDIKVRLEDGKFTASGSVWNRLKTDINSGGQNLDEILEYFPDNPTVAMIHTIWKKHHLNNMNPGTQFQEDFLAEHKASGNLSVDADYTECCDFLRTYGFYEVMYRDEPYTYGSAWITQEIPKEILDLTMDIIQKNEQKINKASPSKNPVCLNDDIHNALKI